MPSPETPRREEPPAGVFSSPPPLYPLVADESPAEPASLPPAAGLPEGRAQTVPIPGPAADPGEVDPRSGMQAGPGQTAPRPIAGPPARPDQRAPLPGPDQHAPLPGPDQRAPLPGPDQRAHIRPAAKGAPLPPSEPALQHRAVAALFIALLSLAGFLGFNINLRRGVFLVIYALLAGATALWLAVTAMRRARRARTARPRGSVTATAIAAVGIGLSAVMLLAFALFGHQLSAYGQCLSGTNTISAQQSCYSQFSRALNREITLLG
jgi:hypothetical protein